jgi:hypothetical protein
VAVGNFAIIFSSFDTAQVVNQKPTFFSNLEESYIMNKTPHQRTTVTVLQDIMTQSNTTNKGVNFAMSSAKTNGTLYLRDSQIIQIWS